MKIRTRLWHFVFALCFFAFTASASAQAFFRFRADFSIKEKLKGAEQGNLVTGTVYFDKNIGSIDWEIRFPEAERWLVRDTTLVRLQADSVLNRQTVGPMGEFSFFAMMLDQQLADFGLAKAGYTPGEVRQEEGQVLSTWQAPEQLRPMLGPVTLMQEQKRLVAIAFFTPEDKLAAKYYFRDYETIGGLPVPTKTYQIFYRPDGEFVRLISFKNVVLDEVENEAFYDFPWPR